jgi:hypothetical protein
MDATIDKVYLNVKEKQYLVVGTNLPVQVIEFESFSDWDTVNDMNDEPLFDVQIDDDMSGDTVTYNFQYVNLIPNPEDDGQTLIMGSDWRNPDKLIVTSVPISEIILMYANGFTVMDVNYIAKRGVMDVLARVKEKKAKNSSMTLTTKIEIYDVDYNGKKLEVHVNATEERFRTGVYSEVTGDIAKEVYDYIDNELKKIDNV